MGSKDQLFLLKLESCEDQYERAELIQDYLQSFSDNRSGKIKTVPDFPEGLEWLNCQDALSFKSNLRGKLCILDFFTYCCINCMHILPDLHALEAKHSIEDGVVIIGVHSAKFENEKVSSNILNAVLRYGISHPVVNDGDAFLWNVMEIACWPTLVIVGPKGEHLLSLVGEGHNKTLTEFVKAALKWFKSEGQISNHQINLSLAKDTLPKTSLSFPGKLSVKKSGNKLAISDTGHHRVLIVDTNGMVETVIGGGTSAQFGFLDGDFKEARFNSPQGVAWKDHLLFVADTENHAIRMIDLKTHKVTTVAGTGKQGNDKIGGKTGCDQPISSPWDVVVGPAPGSLNILDDESVLYIAMAGSHQIWGLCLTDTRWLKGSEQKAWTCLRFSGSGAEENKNNSYPHKTGFAQPSGLSIARGKPFECIFIADSESSSVRSVSITSGGSKALVGADRDPMNLFAFGDVDGSGVEAKLQHPLAVSWNVHSSQLFVADSYNHKIKVVEPGKKTCKTFLGTGTPGSVDAGDGPQFNEPGGLDISPDGNTLYVADTNNHAICVVDLKNNSISTLPIITNNLDETDVTDCIDSSPSKAKHRLYRRLAPANAKVINREPVVVLGTSVELQFTFTLPKQCKLTAGVKSKWQCTVFDATEEDSEGNVVACGVLSSPDTSISAHVKIPVNMRVQIQVEAKIYFCEPDGACYMQGVLFKLPITQRLGETENALRLHYDCIKP